MSLSVALLVPLLVLVVVALFAFAGCTPFDAAPNPPQTTTPPKMPPATTTPPKPDPTPVPTPVPKTYSEVITAEAGLRGYWRLGEPAGTGQAADSKPAVAMRRPGTYHTPGVTLGVPGVLRFGKDPGDTAAAFDGQGFVDIDSHDDVVNPPFSFSIEAWVRPAFTGAVTGVVVGSYAALPEHTGFVLEVLQNATGALTARVRVGGGGLVVGTVQADMGPGTAIGGWRLVVATYSGPTKELKLYVSAGGATTVVASPGAVDYKPVDLAIDPFRIGVGRNESQGPPVVTPENFFVGDIDEVALYDRPLDAATVTAHFSQATTP
jgi:hypothetical protein